MSYRIGAYLIDPAAHEIRCEGALVPVEPQVFDLLIFLIENRRRTATKDQIIERVWKGRIVSDANLSSRIKAARQALGDDGSAQRLIRTVHGRGFRFVGEVIEVPPPVASKKQQQAGLTQRNEAQAPGAAAPNGPGVLISTGLAWTLAGSRQWVVVTAVCLALLSGSFLVNHLLTRPLGSSPNKSVKRNDPLRPGPAAQKAAPTFNDCDICPEMVELPTGEFMMGSPEGERGRELAEGPQRRVVIARRLALGKFEVTVDQFGAFVTDTGLAVGTTCNMLDPKTRRWTLAEASFRQPGFEALGTHPAVCVSWHEAQAYAAWLGRRTGKPYRLPSEAEWEYAARAGTTTSYSFGDDERRLCDYGRFADLASSFRWRGGCRSAVIAPGPIQVGKLKPNPWGLFDMHGNAWEWAADCWTADAHEIPTDGSAYSDLGGCEVGVVRGGSWGAEYHKLRSATRLPMVTANRRFHVGFRVALSLGPR